MLVILATSLGLASCENNSTNSASDHQQAAADLTVTGGVSATPASDVNSSSNMDTGTMEMSLPPIYGAKPDWEQDSTLLLGGVSSILWALPNVTYSAEFAGGFAVLGVLIGFVDILMGNTPMQFAILQTQIADLQSQISSINTRISKDENIFYNYVNDRNDKDLGQYANQFYKNGYDYLASNDSNSLTGQFYAAFATANNNTPMPNMESSTMLSVIAKPEKMKVLVNGMGQSTNIEAQLLNVSNSYLDVESSGGGCFKGGGSSAMCFKAVRQNKNVVGNHSSDLLTLLSQFNTAEQSRIIAPASTVTSTVTSPDIVKVFDSGNSYVNYFTTLAGTALQKAYSIEFMVNWLNYKFGMANHNDLLFKKMSQDDFAQSYQIAARASGTKFNGYYTYKLADNESANTTNYLTMQKNLRNVYLARMEVLSLTGTQHLVSDHLSNPYSPSHYLNETTAVFQDKNYFNGMKITFNEGKLYNQTIEAKQMLAKKMPLPVRNPYRSSDKDKPNFGYFYTYYNLRDINTCMQNYNKKLITSKTSSADFNRYCPSAYPSSYYQSQNTYDGHKFSILVDSSRSDIPNSLSKSMTYPEIGYRCDLTTESHANLFSTSYSPTWNEVFFLLAKYEQRCSKFRITKICYYRASNTYD